jgi:hypothetical protein
MSNSSQDSSARPASGLEAPGVLDALVVDEKAGRVVLVMVERRPWASGELQLWQLQEKLNAYVSFALDGEMEEMHPEISGKPICIQLRSDHDPSPEVLGLATRVREQLKLMEIDFEVWHTGEENPGGGCGSGNCMCG